MMFPQICKVGESSLQRAAEIIKAGRTVGFPTETVYGLGADALNPAAVALIYELKQRPSFDPLIVHVTGPEHIQKLTLGSDPRIILLAEEFWPGPLTLILPKSRIVPDIVSAGLPTVGIRIPANETALELIRRAGCPIAAPSANKFGSTSPTLAKHVCKSLPEVELVLDGGKTRVGIESTIITLTERGFAILRPGIITKEQIEEIVPFDKEYNLSLKDRNLAPGMGESHYAPAKPLFLLEAELPRFVSRDNTGLLSFSGRYDDMFDRVLRLTDNSNLAEYATNLFEALHSFDDSDLTYLAAEPVPERGIGIAIMDRLRKASAKSRKLL